MKMLVAGVFQMQGTGKSGNPYDFAQVNGLVPVENVKNDKMRKHGVGYDLSTIALDDACLAQFKAFEGKFPLVLDLETDVRPRMGNFETVVVGIKGVAAAIKAA